MTIEGAEKIRKELEHLETIERRQIIQAIAEARAHGDLKENAEYHAAKDRQGFIEARIRDIQHKLSHVQVVDLSQRSNDGVVVFGVTVTLYDIDEEREVTYKIVGEDEADVREKKISITSPVARALIGKSVGAEVDVQTPAGLIAFEILKVEYL